jgi:Ni/Fe-hydrogenase subunit HybB-like protein
MTDDVLDRIEADFDDLIIRLIRKYAVLLTIFLAIQVLLTLGNSMLLPYLQNSFGWNMMDTAMFTVYLSGPAYIGHLVVALVVYSDMRKTNTVSFPLIILTLLYDAVGVCFFIIYLAYQELAKRIGRHRKSQAS